MCLNATLGSFSLSHSSSLASLLVDTAPSLLFLLLLFPWTLRLLSEFFVVAFFLQYSTAWSICSHTDFEMCPWHNLLHRGECLLMLQVNISLEMRCSFVTTLSSKHHIRAGHITQRFLLFLAIVVQRKAPTP